MLDIAAGLADWCARGRSFAVATVVGVDGSAPRGPGAALAVDADGAVLGGVSGGCVEGEVYRLCREVLGAGRSARERFAARPVPGARDRPGSEPLPPGFEPLDSLAPALTCGGTIEVIVLPYPADDPRRSALAAALAELSAEPGPPGAGPDPAGGRALALVRVPDGPERLRGGLMTVRGDGGYSGGLGGGAALDRRVATEAAARLDLGRTGPVTVPVPPSPLPAGREPAPPGASCGGTVTVLVECRTPPPRLLVFGAVDFAAALARVGRFLGMRVTVCDARPALTTPARFPDAHEVVVDRPARLLAAEAAAGRLDRRAAVCVLGHDPAFDVPVLREALRLPVGYVGAMGSRRTHEDRLRRLAEAGLRPDEVARLRSPIGLDLGARTPEETALSIAAEIVALRRGGTGEPLTGTAGPIHRDPPPAPGPATTPAPDPAAAAPSGGPDRAPGRVGSGRSADRPRSAGPGSFSPRSPGPARATGGRPGR
ncbi:XdhC family protein [Streptomyces sp. ST2-7A]|uniref:XdhC family protein n=1 Tax=Streptomyces sp. ST2-7A TaxID=2907214 RepID=UPI001F3850F1|nr:XdhC/CoxI family protein [Streptomyces sp. ST2-7A]MCE7082053.1 XdhC family protein [Streptomyces sp. ST2-7A]